MHFLLIFVTQVENETPHPTQPRDLPSPQQDVGQTLKAQRALFSNYLLLERGTNQQVRREESSPPCHQIPPSLLSGSPGLHWGAEGAQTRASPLKHPPSSPKSPLESMDQHWRCSPPLHRC